MTALVLEVLAAVVAMFWLAKRIRSRGRASLLRGDYTEHANRDAMRHRMPPLGTPVSQYVITTDVRKRAARD